jgi:DNA-3-methyladenine glycosylase I
MTSDPRPMTNDQLIRCAWIADPLMQKYHDEEWGVPLHDDRKLFEFMVLDAFQAGLSWKTILNDEAKYESLLADVGIIRNRSKIRATISNAVAFLEVQKEFGTFDRYIWSFVGHKPIVNHWKSLSDLPAKTADSDKMSKDLSKRGFKFVGSTICYAFMQAAGMVNDHVVGCFRYNDLRPPTKD